jgi:DNA-binding NtrC family response regulator
VVELTGVALRGDAGASESLAYVMKGAPGRVLIVDDEPHVRGLLRDFLTSVGNEVATAASGADALKMVPVFQPEVILTDMLMPGMSGADLLDALRRAGVTVPVILISGQPITMPEGFFGLLRKPFDLRKLAEVVTAAIDQGRTERA